MATEFKTPEGQSDQPQSVTPASVPNASDDNPRTQIFRPEALAYYTGGRRTQGDLLRLTPTWTQWSYWLLLLVVLVGSVGVVVGTVDQYVSGPAVVLPATRPATTSQLTMVALLPGHVRPLLQPGMTLYVTLAGYPQAAQRLTIDTVAEQIIGPAEVQHRLGTTVADTLPVTGPVVMVQAHPTEPYFLSDTRRLTYSPGMQGTAEVSVRSERLLFLLAPMLRTWLGIAGSA